MADDKNLTGGTDRDRVAGNEDYEVRYLADKLNISTEQVQQAIKAVGNDRDKIETYLKDKR